MIFVAAILIGVGAFFSVCNWLCLLSSLRRRRFVSPVFPASSLLTTLGLALADSTRPYWWVGLLTDYTFFALLAATPRLISEAWRLSSFTRQQLLVADDGPRHFTLSLHRQGHFLLRATFDTGVPCNEHGAFISSFGAPGRWEEALDGHLRLWSYREGRELLLQPLKSDYVASETHYPDDAPFPYDRLDGLQFHRHA
jgi:hypothetical protein